MAKESKPKAAPKKTTTKSASAAKAKTTTKTAAAKTVAPKAAAPKVAPPKAAVKSKKQTQAGGGGAAPMVDTNFAAEAAARMLATRARLAKSGPQAQPASEGRESGSFKQMRENINKPAAGGMAAAMGSTFTWATILSRAVVSGPPRATSRSDSSSR